MEHKENTFTYTYSASEQAEVAQIRSKYLPKAEDKMDRLRRLDRGVTQKAQVWALTLGILGALILGTGMSLAMTELGSQLGSLAMVIGIVVGIAGMILVALAYPVYNRILQKQRQRIAPEVLRLTEELLK